MRIVLDSTPLSLSSGGLRRYTAELALALATAEPDDEVILVSDQVIDTPTELASRPNVSTFDATDAPMRSRWWSAGLALALVHLGADVFHGTDFAVPYVPITPSVLTLHDLSPWKDDAICPEGSDRVRARTPVLARIAKRVITPTEAIRREAIDRFGLSPRTVCAIHHGVRPIQAEPRPSAGGNPYVIYVGDGGKRKNIETLLAAWRAARSRIPNLNLVLIGPDSKRFADEPGLHCEGVVNDEELSSRLAGAAMLVYPSVYEGFGLPVVEAMSLGVPVLTSDDPALVEVAGGCAVHFPARDKRQLSDAIVRVASDASLQRRLREDGRVRASEISWQRTAQQTRRLYLEAIEAW